MKTQLRQDLMDRMGNSNLENQRKGVTTSTWIIRHLGKGMPECGMKAKDRTVTLGCWFERGGTSLNSFVDREKDSQTYNSAKAWKAAGRGQGNGQGWSHLHFYRRASHTESSLPHRLLEGSRSSSYLLQVVCAAGILVYIQIHKADLKKKTKPSIMWRIYPSC